MTLQAVGREDEVHQSLIKTQYLDELEVCNQLLHRRMVANDILGILFELEQIHGHGRTNDRPQGTRSTQLRH